VINDEISYTPFEEAITKHKPMKQDLIKMADILAH
jgi:hypothetical protein